jgi:hypothetical protein
MRSYLKKKHIKIEENRYSMKLIEFFIIIKIITFYFLKKKK